MKDLQQKVIEFRDARNWKQFHTPKNLAQALASEVGELNDLFLWDREASLSKVFLEVADIAIYLLSLCDVMGIDLKLAIEEKLRINENKYLVEKANGNARKYTEL